MSEAELVSGCIQGDSRSQQLLFERYASGLSKTCKRYINNDEDAKDVFQEGLIKIFNSLETFKFNSSLETWMTRIMINTSLSALRKPGKYEFIDIEDSKNAGIVYPANSNSDEESISPRLYESIEPDKLLALIQKLPAGYRAVLNMYAIDGFPHREIAQKLGITENTSKTQLMKARKKLKEIISEEIKNPV